MQKLAVKIYRTGSVILNTVAFIDELLEFSVTCRRACFVTLVMGAVSHHVVFCDDGNPMVLVFQNATMGVCGVESLVKDRMRVGEGGLSD